MDRKAAPPLQKPSSHRIVVLDGLRGLAALSVMLMHDALAYGQISIFAHAYTSVDMFFLLSGFVLTLSFEEKFNRGMEAKAFIRLRIRRLWWVMAIGLALGMPHLLLQHEIATSVLVFCLATSLLLLPGPAGSGQVYGLNAPCWSLTCELVANFYHALGLYRLDNRALVTCCTISGVVYAGYTFAVGTGDVGSGIYNWPGGFLRVAYSYPLGALMARYWRTLPPLNLPWWLALGMPVMAMVLCAPWSQTAAVDVPLTLVVMPALFWIVARVDPPARIAPLLSGLGAISYPIYAFNWPLIYWGVAQTRLTGAEYPRALALIGTLVLALLVAVAENRLRRHRLRRAADAMAVA